MKYRNLIQFAIFIMICCGNLGCLTGEKPVIYLYPTEEIEVTVKLDFKGKLNFIYPNFNSELDAWYIEAHPDGTLINIADGKEYPYLFWDGIFEKECENEVW